MIKNINQDVINKVYDFSDMTNEELRCKFFQKLEECIDLCNNSADILEWVKNEGLENELNELMNIWKDDGTLDNIINIEIINRLKEELSNSINELQINHKNDINVINTKVDTLESNVDRTVNNAIGQMNRKVDISINEQNTKMNSLKEEITTNFNNQASEFQNKFVNLKEQVNEKLKLIMYVKNETELLSAIETAKTTPTIIYIYNDITLNNIIFIPSNCEIKGLGNVTIKASGNINCCFSNFTNNAIGYSGAKNIRIENLTFNGENRTTVALTIIGLGHVENVTIYNCRFKNLHVWHMIELNAVNKGTIENCSFENYGNVGTSGSEAIQLDSMMNESVFPWFGNYDNTSNNDIMILNNKFINVGKTCIGGHSFQKGCIQKNITIKNNYFEKVQTAININDFNNLQILNNKSVDTHFFFKTETVENNCENLLVQGNYHQGFYISSDDGINDERFVGINVSGNKGSLRVSYVNISNNYITLCGGHGIGITADYVTISNNNFFNVRWNGIYHFGGLVATISANTFKDVGKESGRYSIKIGGNSATESKAIVVNGNSIANLYGINVSSNANKIIVSNNVGQINNEVGEACTSTNNIQL